jgi:hypothetical protein
MPASVIGSPDQRLDPRQLRHTEGSRLFAAGLLGDVGRFDCSAQSGVQAPGDAFELGERHEWTYDRGIGRIPAKLHEALETLSAGVQLAAAHQVNALRERWPPVEWHVHVTVSLEFDPANERRRNGRVELPAGAAGDRGGSERLGEERRILEPLSAMHRRPSMVRSLLDPGQLLNPRQVQMRGCGQGLVVALAEGVLD